MWSQGGVICLLQQKGQAPVMSSDLFLLSSCQEVTPFPFRQGCNLGGLCSSLSFLHLSNLTCFTWFSVRSLQEG